MGCQEKCVCLSRYVFKKSRRKRERYFENMCRTNKPVEARTVNAISCRLRWILISNAS